MRDRREIDPHSNDLHCVDVSTYEDVVYDANPRTKCDAEFPIIKETKQERVSNFDFKVFLYNLKFNLEIRKYCEIFDK